MQKIFNVYLYTSLHIALCAAGLYVFSAYVFAEAVNVYYTAFLINGTIIIYNLHRLSTPLLSTGETSSSRFLNYRKLSPLMMILIIVGAVIAVYSYYHLPHYEQLGLLVGVGLSAAYSLPIFTDRKKLRDFPYIKIFVIAFVWVYLTLILPFFYSASHVLLIWLSIERLLFFMAITIPFDIRDYSIDQSTSLGTIPSLIGVSRARKLSVVLLVSGMIIVSGLMILGVITWQVAVALLLTQMISVSLVLRAHENDSDYLFTFWLDGAIILPLLILWLLKLLS